MKFQRIKRILKFLLEIGWFKTIFFNLKYFPLPIAIRIPIIVSRHVRLRCTKGGIELKWIKTGCIRLGFDSVGIFDNRKSRSIWEVSNGTVEFCGSANFGNGFKICVHNGGVLTIGDKFRMTAESTIICYNRISFGSGCLLSWDILVMDTDFHSIYNLESNNQINQTKKIICGNNVWIGCRSLILKGSRIPDGVVIAAGSTISNRLSAANTIYASLGKVLRSDIYWKP